jgi:D-glycero-alpha-D-manno-heptose-7-phosphate kinase
MIMVRSPYRVSLFGGGTDYTDYILENGWGLCVGFAIDKYSYITVRELPPFFKHKTRLAYSEIECVEDNKHIEHNGIRSALQYMNCMDKPLEIIHNSDLPTKTGLGTSSAFLVALAKALYYVKGFGDMPALLTAVTASNIEQSYSLVGLQDHLFSSLGGLGQLEFTSRNYKDINKITFYKYNQKYYELFEENGLLFFTGEQRIATDVLSTYIETIPKNEYQQNILSVASEISYFISTLQADVSRIGEALDRVWYLKKKLSPNITTPKIDSLYDEAMKAGAIGGKLLGAGGGGTMFFIAEKKNHIKIIDKCVSMGCVHIPYKIDNEGCKRIL